MTNGIRYIGFDVSKEKIAVAIADTGRDKPRFQGMIQNRPDRVRTFIRRLGGAVEDMVICYEAGPCGYGLQRQLTEMGATAIVVAPSLIPSRPGDRVKTDKRDAIKLAASLRAGELTAVWVPGPEEEALRDVVRAREDAKQDLHRARQRISKFLLRQQIRPEGRLNPWTSRHRAWLESLTPDLAQHRIVLADYLLTLDQARQRVQRLDEQMLTAAEHSPHAALIAALQTLRGVATITAVTLVAELGDISRFQGPPQLMSYCGMVPSEYSSGGRRSQGSITKAGNSHVRRAIVESAWSYRYQPRLQGALARRQQGQSESVRAIAWKAQQRLSRRYQKMTGRGPRQRAVVAVGRELLGFIWAISQELRRSGELPLLGEAA